MTPDALKMLSLIETFLHTSVADRVPAALRSEVRAAAKSLGDVRDQLDAAFPLLVRECDELCELVQFAREALGQVPGTRAEYRGAQSLSELKTHHDQLSKEVGDLVLTLQSHENEPAGAALTQIFDTLRQQAGRRLEWQSVFPPDRLVSDVLRETWPKGKN